MRLGLFPYLGLLTALCAAQYAAVTTLSGSNPIMGALIALQLLKVPVAAARARDLGYDGDEAVLAMLPLGNLSLFWKLLGGTPDEPTRQARASIHAGESSALELVLAGLRSLPSSPAAVLAWVALGLGEAVLAEGAIAQLPKLAEIEAETLSLYGQLALGLGAFLVLFAMVQTSRAATVSRASWLPAVFAPGFLGAAAVFLAYASGGGPDAQQMALIGVVFTGVALLPVWAIGGAWAAAVSHLGVRAARQGDKAGFGSWGMAASRTAEVSAPHAGARYAVWLGLQFFVVPGLMYTTQYGLVDPVAWEEPDARALRRSAELTRGHRQRILRTLLIVAVACALVGIGVGVADLGDFAKLSEVALNPYALSSWAAVVNGMIAGLGFAVFEAAMSTMYFERVDILTEREDLAAIKPATDNVFEAPAT